MADIISGKSRFNGDRNAPVKKVISINREMAASTEDNEDVLDEAAVKRKIRRHKSRVAVVVTIIIIVILAAVYIVSRVIDNYDYSSPLTFINEAISFFASDDILISIG